ncbi:MAG: GTPase Era [Bacteroidota bacterium]
MNKKIINVSVLGTPNCGKSTFANIIIGSQVSMVSSKPHTTRNAILGIFTKDDLQIVFTDTPGIGTSAKKDESSLSYNAKRNVEGNDLCLFMFDITKKIPIHILEFANSINKPKFAFINKIDLVSKGRLLPFIDGIRDVFTDIFCGSVLKEIGLDTVLKYIEEKAENGEWLFDSSTKGLKQIDELINDRTKEVVFEIMNEEIPYKIDVKIINLEDFKNGSLKIEQNIIIPKAYKHIFLGHIKRISISSRIKISEMLKRPVHLFLNLKIKKD